jgi:hypothetical protein
MSMPIVIAITQCNRTTPPTNHAQSYYNYITFLDKLPSISASVTLLRF